MFFLQVRKEKLEKKEKLLFSFNYRMINCIEYWIGVNDGNLPEWRKLYSEKETGKDIHVNK